MTATATLANTIRRAAAIAAGQQAARLHQLGHVPAPWDNTPEGWAKLIGWGAGENGHELRWHFLKAFRETTGERESTPSMLARIFGRVDQQEGRG